MKKRSIVLGMTKIGHDLQAVHRPGDEKMNRSIVLGMKKIGHDLQAVHRPGDEKMKTDPLS